MHVSAPGRLAVVGILTAALLLVLVIGLRLEASDLTPLIVALTLGAWSSFLVLARAAFTGPQIGALTERTLIAFVLALLGTVSTLLVLNTDTGNTVVDRQTASLVFRILMIAVLAIPTGWLFLWLTGNLGDGSDG